MCSKCFDKSCQTKVDEIFWMAISKKSESYCRLLIFSFVGSSVIGACLIWCLKIKLFYCLSFLSFFMISYIVRCWFWLWCFRSSDFWRFLFNFFCCNISASKNIVSKNGLFFDHNFWPTFYFLTKILFLTNISIFD